jgi:hypothetical protein
MKRIAITFGVIAIFGVAPSVAAAGGSTAQLVRPATPSKVQIYRAQIAKVQVASVQVAKPARAVTTQIVNAKRTNVKRILPRIPARS